MKQEPRKGYGFFSGYPGKPVALNFKPQTPRPKPYLCKKQPKSLPQMETFVTAKDEEGLDPGFGRSRRTSEPNNHTPRVQRTQ